MSPIIYAILSNYSEDAQRRSQAQLSDAQAIVISALWMIAQHYYHHYYYYYYYT